MASRVRRCGVGVNRGSLKIQCAQLAVLSGVHFVADMLGNMLPAILPEIRHHFVLSLTVGSVVLLALMLTANGVQMLTGYLRPDKEQPLFTYIGLVLAAAVCLLALAPASRLGVAMVITLAAVSGCGIAVMHPEGLRGVHALDRIPPAISTAVFMTAGYILTITLARRATGPNLGLRMAWIVGGNWGVANLVFMAVAPLAERFGTGLVLKFTPAGYLVSGIVAIWALTQYPAMRVRHQG